MAVTVLSLNTSADHTDKIQVTITTERKGRETAQAAQQPVITILDEVIPLEPQLKDPRIRMLLGQIFLLGLIHFIRTAEELLGCIKRLKTFSSTWFLPQKSIECE